MPIVSVQAIHLAAGDVIAFAANHKETITEKPTKAHGKATLLVRTDKHPEGISAKPNQLITLHK